MLGIIVVSLPCLCFETFVLFMPHKELLVFLLVFSYKKLFDRLKKMLDNMVFLGLLIWK